MRLSNRIAPEIERSLREQDISVKALASITGIDLPVLRGILTGEVRGDARHVRMIRNVLGDDFEPVISETPDPETVRFEHNRVPEDRAMTVTTGTEIVVGDLIAYSRNSGQLWVEVVELVDDPRSAYQNDQYVRLAGVQKSIRLTSDRFYRIARKRGA